MSDSTASTIEKRPLTPGGRPEDVVIVRKFGMPILVPFSRALLADGDDRVIAVAEDLVRGFVA